MAKLVRVRLQWLTCEEGGRNRPFVGGKYAPTARFLGENDDFSVVVHFTNIDLPNPTEGTLELLFPEASRNQDRIGPGAELEIMEGGRMAAHCHVVTIVEDAPEAVLNR